MRTLQLCCSSALAAVLALQPLSAAAADEYTDSELSADIVTLVMPFATYGIAKSKDDDAGEGQFLRSTGVSLVVNTLLRGAFNETSWGTRPNGRPYGFPSGHAAFVTSSAAFLQDRYGWKYGVPAYALVGYVSNVRIQSNHHRWRDIGAGVALSVGVSMLFVTPKDATHIAPIVGPDWLGIRIERSF